MEIEFDARADAIYVHLLSKPYAYGVDLDDWRRVDYSVDDEPIGVELLAVSRGVNVHQLPYSDEVAQALQAKGIIFWRAEQHSFFESGYPKITYQFSTPLLTPIEPHASQVKEGSHPVITSQFSTPLLTPIESHISQVRERVTA